MEINIEKYMNSKTTNKGIWYQGNDKTRFRCWNCPKEWKKGDVVRIVPSIDVPGTTDYICNKCYEKWTLK